MKRLPYRPVWFAAAAVLAALCAAWAPLLLHGLVPVDGNMIVLTFPNWSMLRSLGAGNLLPAWNPWRGMGEPFFANPVTMAAYPVMRLFAGLDDFAAFMRSWTVFHTLLAAFFTGALARRLTKSPVAAATAALLAGLNASFTGRVTFPSQFAAAAWLPAVLYFQQELSPLGLGISLAMQWLAGFPPFAILGVAAVSAWACGQGRKGLICLVQGGLWALGLAAVQLIPFLELMGRVGRNLVLDPATAREYSVAPLELLKMAFVPQWIHFSPLVSGDPAIVCFYVGPVAWGLAAWAVLRGGRRERLLGAGCATALLLSLGGHLPGFDAMFFLRMFRFPANWLHLATTALALLAALGAARLRSTAWAWTAVAALGLDLVVFAQVPRAAWSLPSFLNEPPALARSLRDKNSSARIYHTDELLRVWEGGVLETEDDYLLMRDYLAPSYGTAFGISEANSHQTLRLKPTIDYLARMSNEGPRSLLADWAGIETVVGLKRGARRVSRDSIGVTDRGPARPRVFLQQPNGGEVTMTSYEPGRAEVRIDAVQEATAIFSEMDYPGWLVFLDGRPAPKILFAGAFPSVTIPKGRHDVQFIFKPFSVLLGGVISLLTACALIVMARTRYSRL